MAKKVLVEYIDDIDKTTPAVETMHFSLDGAEYEIDVNEKNAARLRADVEEWTRSARRSGGRRHVSAPGAAATKSPKNPGFYTLVREWARKEGIPVNNRGRLSDEVITAYNNRAGR